MTYIGREITKMSEIKVIEKPDSVSFDTISSVLRQAHKEHVDKGIVMRVPTLSPDELQKLLEENGKCFVAMSDDKVVGTVSYHMRTISRWYYQGELSELTMDGILPEYQGKHIFSLLEKRREDTIRESGCKAMMFDTAADNTHRIQIAKKNGFVLVDFCYVKSGHYSVVMVKWFDGCPFARHYCALRFGVKKVFRKLLRLLTGK